MPPEVVGGCGSAGELVLPSMLERWEVEEDPATRLDVVLALGQAVYASDVLDLLRGLLDDPEPQVRLAAVRALAVSEPGLPERRLELLPEAVRDPGVGLWRHTAAMGCGGMGVWGVRERTAALLCGPWPG
ncbi:HEAT repeat domain-containing protein [Streptomyces sp. NPDC058157]|uniref:HEAT repeat domain-containing protein n=1 Tax=Streptomyces sp. NPDC058157 TaxID=3346360 RepID=UPI0036F0F962